MHFFVLMALLPFCLTFFVGLRSAIGHSALQVPAWTNQVTLAVILLGLLASGTVITPAWLWGLLYVGATALMLGLGGRLLRHRQPWVMLMLAPLLTLGLAHCWVTGQSFLIKGRIAPVIDANVVRWNQSASLDVELPARVQPQDIRVYRGWSAQKRVGLLNDQQQLEFVVDIKGNHIVSVTRVNYLTSGDLWVWPFRL